MMFWTQNLLLKCYIPFVVTQDLTWKELYKKIDHSQFGMAKKAFYFRKQMQTKMIICYLITPIFVNLILITKVDLSILKQVVFLFE